MLSLDVSSNSINTAINWQNTYGLTHFVGQDRGNTVWSMYGRGYVPHNVIIGQDMVVRYTNYGYNISYYQNLIDTELNKPPLQPQNLSVITQNPVSIVLSWDAVPHTDVTGYLIDAVLLKGKGNDKWSIDAGLTTVFEVTNLDLYSSYQFTVKAYDYRGNQSAPSDSTVGTTVGSVPTISNALLLLLLLILSVLVKSSLKGRSVS